MKVRIFGFGLNLGKGINYQEFFRHLQTLNGQDFGNRILTVAQKDDWWTGVLITVKDVKSFCEMRQAGEKFRISARQLEQGTSVVDFNFFAIYEPTGRGLYQHYHFSSHVSTFCAFLKQRYESLKKLKINAEIAEQGISDSVRQKAVQDRYANSLKFTIMCRQETLEQRIAELQRVRNIEFEYTTLDFENDPLTPLNKVAKKRTERFVFGKTNADIVKSTVTEFLGRKLFKRLRLEGIDPQGIEQVYKLQNDYDTFAEEDYDTVVTSVEMDSNDLLGSLEKSPVLEKILTIANTKAKALLTASESAE